MSDVGRLHRRPHRPSKDGENYSMIVVMGVTGSGKSYLINKLAGSQVVPEGSDLKSCTRECAMVPVEIENTRTLLIDTPGFDDTERTDSEILTEIAKILSAQYEAGVQLRGIIYVHRITDIRYSGSSIKTFEVFKRICGESALRNVLLVTTRWNEVDESVGSSREHQLKEDFWSYMLIRGSCMSRFHGDRSSAVIIVSQLLIKDAVVLQLQREMIDQRKRLDETAAGSFVDDGLEKMKQQYEKELADLENLKRMLLDDDRKMKQQVQRDWERERARLRRTEEQQVSLRRDIAEEVREEIRDDAKKKPSGALSNIAKFLPFISPVISIIGMFVGIPPGSFEMLTSWFGVLLGLLGGDGS